MNRVFHTIPTSPRTPLFYAEFDNSTVGVNVIDEPVVNELSAEELANKNTEKGEDK